MSTSVARRFKVVAIIGKSPYVEATECGMRLLDPEVPFEDMEKICKKMRVVDRSYERAERCLQLNIADHQNICEQLYGEKAFQMYGEGDWNRYRTWRWVSRYVPLEQRRPEPEITADHYRFVAPLSKEDQEYYLSLAIREKLSTRKMRDQIDCDMVQKMVKDMSDDDITFWKYYWNETGCNYRELEEAIKQGKEEAQEKLDSMKELDFDDWYGDYKASDGYETKTEYGHMNDSFMAGKGA